MSGPRSAPLQPPGGWGGPPRSAQERPAALLRVICVYTYDYADEADVRRVREELRALGFIDKLSYKADEDTLAGKYAQLGDRNISKYRE